MEMKLWTTQISEIVHSITPGYTDRALQCWGCAQCTCTTLQRGTQAACDAVLEGLVGLAHPLNELLCVGDLQAVQASVELQLCLQGLHLGQTNKQQLDNNKPSVNTNDSTSPRLIPMTQQIRQWIQIYQQALSQTQKMNTNISTSS